MGELEDIDRDIKNAQYSVDRADAIKRLKGNKDFDKVFVEGYLTVFAAEQVRAKAAPYNKSPEVQKDIDNQLIAIGYFDQYLQRSLAEGEASKDKIASAEETRHSILNGEEE